MGSWVHLEHLARIAGEIALPLLFPDGRLPGRGGPWVAWAGAAAASPRSACCSARARSRGRHATPNPLGASDLPTQAMFTVGQVLTTAASVGAPRLARFRLRRSRGVERQQIKWLAYVLGIAIVVAVRGRRRIAFSTARVE